MCNTYPPPATPATATTRLWSSQGHYFSVWPHLCLWQQFFLYVLAKITAPICHCGTKQKMQKELFQRIRNWHFRSTRLIRLSSLAPGKCSIILLQWFFGVKKQEWNNIQTDAISPQIDVFWQTHIRPKPSSITLHRLAFSQAGAAIYYFGYYLWGAATLWTVAFQQRGSRLYQEPTYLWAFFPPSKTESNVTIFAVIMLSFMSARLCAGAAVVFI